MIYKANRNNYLKSVGFLALAVGSAFPAVAQTLPAPTADQAISTEAQDQQASTSAQTTDAPQLQSDIIVTGSSIRGAPAVGSNLISIGREAIEDNAPQTVQQLLKTVPAIGGAQGPSQGGFLANDSAGAAVPQIHGLGGSNSSSTLVVIDGHRFPLTGLIRNLADPNFIPTNSIERVEVLAEGASSIYGSDATAGVLNFITRRNLNGLELNAQYGFADDYKQWSAGAAYGNRWDDGGFGLFYTYSDRGNLLGADRPLTNADQRARGGTNFGNFNCSPATFQPAGSTTIYSSPYGAANGVSNAAVNSPCEQSKYQDLIPQERRHSLMFKIDQQVGDRLKLNADVVYSLRNNVQRNSVTVASSTGAAPGAQLITATVFGPGSGRGGQINPFFVAPTGTTATSGTIRFDANELFPDGARLRSRSETFYAYANAEYKLTDDWRLTGFAIAGVNNAKATIVGSISQSTLLLALNGTTNANGVLTQASIPNTNVIVTNVPLTAANAIDVWNPRATNRTSAATLAALRDSLNYQASRQTIRQFNLKLDGTLADNWAGEIKLALGADITRFTQDAEVVEPNNTGPSSTGSSFNQYRYVRNVTAFFGELLVPIVSPEMNVPFARRIDFNVSGRFDHYNEFGDIKNPKFAANWEVVEGLKFRGNYATSFVAPQFSTYGPDLLSGVDGRSIDTFFGPQNGTLVVDLSQYPEARGIPGCNAAGLTQCTLGTANIAGMRLDGANPDVKPSKGSTWALGVDLAPRFAPGLTASITYWSTDIKGTSGGPPLGLVIASKNFHDLLKIYPNGATPAEIEAYRGGRRQRSPLASGPIYFGLDFRNFNVYYLFVKGIDFDVHYRHKFDWGAISGGVAGTYKTQFDQNAGPGEPKFSVLNKNRFNGTFPTNRTDLRFDLNLDVGGFSANAAVNHTPGFTFFGTTALNPVVTTGGRPTSGGDPVKSYTTVDLNFSYKFGDALPGQPSVFVKVDNLFDRYPPFENTALGFDNFTSFVLGRSVTAGLRVKF